MRAAILGVAFVSLCLAQVDDNTVTVTATRSITLQPDRAVVGISLTTPSNAGLDDVLAALQGTGFDAGDLLSRVSSWQFSKTIPLSSLNDVLASVLAAQQKLEKQKAGFDLRFYVNSQSSASAQQAPAVCPIPTLFSNAQAQARQLAAAAGVGIGGVVSMSQPGTGPAAVPTFAVRSGDFSAIYDPLTGVPSGGLASFLVGVLSPFPLPLGSTCSLTVQFQLVR